MTPDEKQALGYAIAILRNRLDVEASHNAAIIRGYINALAALRSRPAPPDDLVAGFVERCDEIRHGSPNAFYAHVDRFCKAWRNRVAPAPVAAPDDLVALRLVLKCAERACDADNLDAAVDYVREAIRQIAPTEPTR